MTRHKKSAPHTSTHPSIGPETPPRVALKPEQLKESRSAAPEFTRPQAVALLPPARPVHATRARHGCAKQGQRHDGAKATKTPAPQAAPCGAARSHSGAGHVRAGRLAAPIAQTRRGPHDGDET